MAPCTRAAAGAHPPATVSAVTVFLVRHASAGARNEASPTDVERSLDGAGRDQAARLVGLMAEHDVRRILSSPALRCIQSVEPLAAQLGLDVEVHDDLFEGTAVGDAWELLEWAAHHDGDVVLCSHGDLIPELIRRAQLRGMEIPGKSGCSKGSVWELRWDGNRFDCGIYTPVKAHV